MLADPKARGRYMGLYSLVTGLGRTIASSVSSLLMPYALREPLALWGFVLVIATLSSGIYLNVTKGALTVQRSA
jgi:MFS family permease